MLMFIFGAGASYDSDPTRPPTGHDLREEYGLYRPPLATQLFEPPSREGQSVVTAYPRANALVMAIREAVASGKDIEEFLQDAFEHAHFGTHQQLLALRVLVSKLMSKIPTRWSEQCDGRTNYVRLIDTALGWLQGRHGLDRPPIVVVTFNYDTLIEAACESVFGMRIASMDDYITKEDLHLYRPHGAVNWLQRAHAPGLPTVFPHGLEQAVLDHAVGLEFQSEFRALPRGAEPDIRRESKSSDVWVPGLMLPLRYKAEFTFPDNHLESLEKDLASVNTVVAVGWRARETHFLELIRTKMRNRSAELVVVSESHQSALDTAANLAHTGAFRNFSTAVNGFSSFASARDEASDAGSLSEVLRGGGSFHSVSDLPAPSF